MSLSYYNRGLRWVGRSATCVASADWVTTRLFFAPATSYEAELCTYRWVGVGLPNPTDVALLRTTYGAVDLTEDAPVLTAMRAAPEPPKGGPPRGPSVQLSSQEVAYYRALRTSLRQQVGDHALLPSWPARPSVRVVVLDTAPTAVHEAVTPGLDRHGDTLAYLIRDLVCRPSANAPAADCAVEVTSELAMPWVNPDLSSAAGGHMGSLVDLAQAIERATWRWEKDYAAKPGTTPQHLILNLSVGWEHTPGVAECSALPTKNEAPPAQAVRAALRRAANKGVLIFAAAGNDPGGSAPPKGLTCPGAYQAMPRLEGSVAPVLYAVSGVDYKDAPLETVRQEGNSSLAALGVSGVAWRSTDPVPPLLTGSSVATAVSAAVAALAWTARDDKTADEVAAALFDGGEDLRAADRCAAPFASGCRSRRVTTCGALLEIEAPGASCAVPAARPWGSPSLPAEMAALTSWFQVPRRCSPTAAACSEPVLLTDPPQPLQVPRYQTPSLQKEPWTFPAPISATCPTCWFAAGFGASSQLALPNIGQELVDPVVVVLLDNGQRWRIRLDDPSLADPTGAPGYRLQQGSSYAFDVPLQLNNAAVTAAYLSGFDEEQQFSVTEQIFVSR